MASITQLCQPPPTKKTPQNPYVENPGWCCFKPR
jgi:hypothetical protein